MGAFRASDSLITTWNQFEMRPSKVRPTNLARNWYLDHEKRLEDAEIAQYGIDDDQYHADGVHRRHVRKWDEFD